MKGLSERGRTFVSHRGGSGHLTIYRGDRRSVMPSHGSRKELGKVLVERTWASSNAHVQRRS
jgi:mRNA interferase HicA